MMSRLMRRTAKYTLAIRRVASGQLLLECV